MSSRELERVEVMGRVASGTLKLVHAAEMLELSYRHTKRLWRRYRKKGPEGLKHGHAGRCSNRGKPKKLRRRVLQLIRKKYSGTEETRFGPTLATEHLAEEDGIVIDHETLRRWMLAEGLWSRQRKRTKQHQRRDRKAHLGELVQLDGSFHDWLEGRGPRGCLMDMVDDATSRTEARLGKEETIWAAVGVLLAWIKKYGVPRALYTDWKNVYKRKATPAEQLRGQVPLTQFGRMCQKLGIRIIAASTPQAKGRVERVQWSASRPADQETAAARDRQLRSSEPVSGRAVSGGAQPSFRASGSRAGRLSSAEATSLAVTADLPLGDRADNRQRLGDSSSWPLSATAT
jgi:transposase